MYFVEATNELVETTNVFLQTSVFIPYSPPHSSALIASASFAECPNKSTFHHILVRTSSYSASSLKNLSWFLFNMWND